MALPVVVIVGRPNVGKSSLLNSLARQRISIVDPRAGITRDQVSVIIEHDEHYMELVDTGGIGIIDDDQLEEHVEEQIRYAIARADVIIFLVDVATGLVPLDQAVAQLLRRVAKPIILVANKVDDPIREPEAADFGQLGFGQPLCISALHGHGRTRLLNLLVEALGPTDEGPPEAPDDEAGHRRQA